MLTWLPALVLVMQAAGPAAASPDCIALSSRGRLLSGSPFIPVVSAAALMSLLGAA